jgi:hypothetical protein
VPPVRHHHENWDGILAGLRHRHTICANLVVADCFDALTSDRLSPKLADDDALYPCEVARHDGTRSRRRPSNHLCRSDTRFITPPFREQLAPASLSFTPGRQHDNVTRAGHPAGPDAASLKRRLFCRNLPWQLRANVLDTHDVADYLRRWCPSIMCFCLRHRHRYTFGSCAVGDSPSTGRPQTER